MNTQSRAVATHTPTPWRSEHSTAGGHDLHAIFDANGNAFGHFTSYAARTNEERWLGTGRPQEQIAFIVRACNSHAQLMAALDDLLSTCEASGIRADLLATARAALQSAKE